MSGVSLADGRLGEEQVLESSDWPCYTGDANRGGGGRERQCLSRGHLTMPGDVFCCHHLRERCAAGI